ncbi:hypothetical protein [Maribellus maritimus]|uniref:hypothetical protein n=1 Tax=Maribellus maritimus TaxID=2870838 RepID=UPI001EEBEAAF|nr:hypothetical protein [Maribellus maritimus]MCG6191261.1 hypothetical protein [Maribellus maritimus]
MRIVTTLILISFFASVKAQDSLQKNLNSFLIGTLSDYIVEQHIKKLVTGLTPTILMRKVWLTICIQFLRIQALIWSCD